MSVFSYKRFKVLLNADSKKVQGLRTGDIVRRQYFDGTNVIYSLMAVLDTARTKLLSSRISSVHCWKVTSQIRGRSSTS